MDRRFFAWMLLTMSLFLLWSSMTQRAELKKREEADAAALREKKKLEADEKRQELAAKALEVADIPPPTPAPETWVTLGSFNPDDSYRIAATFSSRGAGLVRAELIEQTKPGRFRFRSLDHRGGYLGYLAPTSINEGLRVNSIPVGSPAALAINSRNASDIGLKTGDVITKLDGVAIKDELELETLLKKRKPGTTVHLAIQRKTSEEQTSEFIFDVKLIEAPLDVIRMQNDLAREEIPGNLLRPSLMTTLAKIDDVEIRRDQEFLDGLEATLKESWEQRPLDVENGMGVEFVLPLRSYLAGAGIKANLELVKRYQVQRSIKATDSAPTQESLGYHLDYEAFVRNLDDASHTVALRHESMNGLTLEAWWYAIKLSQSFMSAAGARDVVLARKTGPLELITRRTIQENTRAYPDQPDGPFFGPDFPLEKRSFRYLGMDQQYFVTAFLPHPDQPSGLDDLSQGATRTIADLTESKPYKDIGTNVGFWFDTKPTKLDANNQVGQQYRIFVGPKDPNILDAYGLAGTVYFGWPIFEWVAKPLSVILHTFYSIVRNYGLAIVMLTVLVRSCMFPLSRRAAIMGQRMQEMQPEMKRITELYKDDVAKRGQEMQALYKKYNVNPMASCLPVFVQIPIFIGLYRCVSTDIELRNQPLIPGLNWCSNLAGPDMLTSFPSWMPDFIAGKGSGWFGPYFNLLPIVTIILFIVQQKVLMPKATDEQTRMTQQMMMFMTIFMGVLFFKVPAGLCIYFVTSSIWSLVERRLVKKYMPKSPVQAATIIAPATSPATPPSNNRAKTSSNKPPETLSDMMGSIKELWGKARSKADAANAASSPGARKKPPQSQRSKKK